MHRLLFCRLNESNGGDICDVPKTGELFHRLLGGNGEPLHLFDQEVRNVVGVAPGADAIDVRSPGQRDRVEHEEPVFVQSHEELDREERITAGLLVHQLRQGPRALRLAMQSIGDKPPDIVEPERGQHDLLNPCPGVADRLESPHERVRRADLVVPVGPDQQQMPYLRMRHQVLEEVERRRIQPLQIVEEQRERVLLAREHPEEAPENHLKAVFGVLRRQVHDRRLRSNNELQLGDKIDDQLAVRAQSLAQGVAPPAKLRLVLAEKGPDETAEGLGQGGVRDVALVLVELARREQAAWRDERLLEFVHHRRLADAGIAGDQHELCCAIGYDSVESAEQRLDLVVPAVKLLRRHQTVRDVVSTERERLDAAMGFPFREALPQIDY